VHLRRAQRGRCVGGEERVAGAGREITRALLQVAHRAPADIGSATSEMLSADCTRVFVPIFSSASCSGSAFSTVAIMPM